MNERAFKMFLEPQNVIQFGSFECFFKLALFSKGTSQRLPMYKVCAHSGMEQDCTGGGLSFLSLEQALMSNAQQAACLSVGPSLVPPQMGHSASANSRVPLLPRWLCHCA